MQMRKGVARLALFTTRLRRPTSTVSFFSLCVLRYLCTSTCSGEMDVHLRGVSTSIPMGDHIKIMNLLRFNGSLGVGVDLTNTSLTDLKHTSQTSNLQHE